MQNYCLCSKRPANKGKKFYYQEQAGQWATIVEITLP